MMTEECLPASVLVSLAVRQSLVLRHEQRFGLLVPGASLSPGLTGGRGRGGDRPAGESHDEGVTGERGRSRTCVQKKKVLQHQVVLQYLIRSNTVTTGTCGRRPVLPDAVGQRCPPVAVSLRVDGGHGGRPLPPGQTRTWGLGFASVGASTALGRLSSSCGQRRTAVTPGVQTLVSNR